MHDAHGSKTSTGTGNGKNSAVHVGYMLYRVSSGVGKILCTHLSIAQQ